MHTRPEHHDRPDSEPLIEEICLEGRAVGSAHVGLSADRSHGEEVRYTTVGQLIAARHQMLCDCYSAQDYSDEWRQGQEAALESQDRGWRKFVLQRSIPKSDWALFRELRDHIRRQITYTERFGSFKSHVERVMPSNDKNIAAGTRELAVRLQSVKLLEKRSIPTSVKVAVKLLAMQNNTNLDTRAPDGSSATDRRTRLSVPASSKADSNDVHVLAKELERNWNKRISLIASLSEYTEQMQRQTINWPNVESMLNIVGRQWKAIGPVARNRDPEVQEQQFSACFDAIRVQLDAEYDRNATKARQLLGASSKLNARPPSSASLESALKLHKQLETIGLLRRADQDAISARIKRNISAVVTARKQQLQSMHQWRGVRAEALEVIKLVDRSSKMIGQELVASYDEVEPQLDKFESLLEQLEEQHEPIHRGASPQALNAVFLHKQAVYMRKLDKESEEMKLEALDAYNEASRLITNVEQALLDNHQTLADQSLAMALDYMNYVKNWPLNGEKILMARLDALKTNVSE